MYNFFTQILVFEFYQGSPILQSKTLCITQPCFYLFKFKVNSSAMINILNFQSECTNISTTFTTACFTFMCFFYRHLALLNAYFLNELLHTEWVAAITPVLLRSAMLKSIEHGQYIQGWHFWNTRCCKIRCATGVMITRRSDLQIELPLGNVWICFI